MSDRDLRRKMGVGSILHSDGHPGVNKNLGLTHKVLIIRWYFVRRIKLIRITLRMYGRS
jgi:hypothetical protein